MNTFQDMSMAIDDISVPQKINDICGTTAVPGIQALSTTATPVVSKQKQQRKEAVKKRNRLKERFEPTSGDVFLSLTTSPFSSLFRGTPAYKKAIKLHYQQNMERKRQFKKSQLVNSAGQGSHEQLGQQGGVATTKHSSTDEYYQGLVDASLKEIVEGVWSTQGRFFTIGNKSPEEGVTLCDNLTAYHVVRKDLLLSPLHRKKLEARQRRLLRSGDESRVAKKKMTAATKRKTTKAGGNNRLKKNPNALHKKSKDKNNGRNGKALPIKKGVTVARKGKPNKKKATASKNKKRATATSQTKNNGSTAAVGLASHRSNNTNMFAFGSGSTTNALSQNNPFQGAFSQPKPVFS